MDSFSVPINFPSLKTSDLNLLLSHLTILTSDILSEMRKTIITIGKEMNADADRAALAGSGTKILIANPKQVQLDINLISELIMTMRHDLGGLGTILQFDALEIHELETIKKIIDGTLKEKVSGLLETQIIEDEDDEKE